MFSEREKKTIIDFFELLAKIARRQDAPKAEPTPNEETKERLIPFSKWNEYYDYPTVPQHRHYRFYGHKFVGLTVKRNLKVSLLLSIPIYVP